MSPLVNRSIASIWLSMVHFRLSPGAQKSFAVYSQEPDIVAVKARFSFAPQPDFANRLHLGRPEFDSGNQGNKNENR